MNTVTEVSIKKKGIGKNGKSYTMYSVTLDDGTRASGFELVRVGEKVSVVRQGKYTNYMKANGEEERMPRSGYEQDWPDEPQPGRPAPQIPGVNAPEAPTARPAEEDGVEATRKHLMQSANLQVLCIKAVDACVAEYLPEVARTSEQFQGLVAQLFIEASGKRSDDGVNWWNYIDKMPPHPIKK